MMQHTIGQFTGSDGYTVFTQQWLPEEPPRAVILLAHGLGEHSGRYAHVALYLVERGFAVCALDHRGHGQSGGPRLKIDDFDAFVRDFRTYYEQVRGSYPDTPFFGYGHSMGALIALLFAAQCQSELAGLITTGTPLRIMLTNAVTVPLLHALARVIPAMPLLPIASGWISRDELVRQRYREDPLNCHGSVTVGFANQLQVASERAADVLPELCLPMLVLHGGADPLSRPSGVTLLRQHVGSPDLTVTVYPGLRHEIHNEPEHETVLGEMVCWLDERLPATAESSQLSESAASPTEAGRDPS